MRAWELARRETNIYGMWDCLDVAPMSVTLRALRCLWHWLDSTEGTRIQLWGRAGGIVAHDRILNGRTP